ncbi:MAG: alpha/beta hydrolase [Actinomycetota bacterium]|nr:alpha/beta hydrolase [Actinomycetota bacterium]
MSVPRRPRDPLRAVLLPGSGSDDDFVRRAFGAALSVNNIELIAVVPQPGAVIPAYHAALDDAAEAPGPLLVGGVSLGAIVAAQWALRHQTRLSGLLIALPPWLGAPGDAPAALSASHSAEQLRRHGLASVLRDVDRTSPTWLAAELSRAWHGQWPELPQALDDAARQHGPTATEVSRLHVPTGIAGAVHDPVHPVTVARAWAGASPDAQLVTIELAALGADPAVLGAACVAGWQSRAARAAIG